MPKTNYIVEADDWEEFYCMYDQILANYLGLSDQPVVTVQYTSKVFTMSNGLWKSPFKFNLGAPHANPIHPDGKTED